MSIRAIRLVNGEEIIADMSRSTESETIVEKPARILVIPSETGGMQIGLMPWIPYSNDETIKLTPQSIMCMVEPTEDLVNEYRKNFGSGLDVPSHNIIY